MKRRLMKFKMEEGKLYLVKESSATHSLDVLTELLKAGYRGTMLSRTPAEEFRGLGNFDVELLWLGERSGKSTLPPRVDELEPWLEGQPSKSVIFIDRLDYILSKNGFEKTLAFVQFLRELAYFSEFIAILSLGAFAMIGWIVLEKLRGHNIPGWSAIMVTMLFLGGIQQFSIAFLGLYVKSIYLESKGRPNYIVASMYGFEAKAAREAGPLTAQAA